MNGAMEEYEAGAFSAVEVTLVVPGRNCEETVGPCLEAALAIAGRPGSALVEIIFVDDGSVDGTREVVGRYPVTVLESGGRGAGAARNAGWRAAASPVVWFVDSDCVAEPDALELLLARLDGSQLGGVGGSYGNMAPDSLLACLVHEEIVERHLSMPERVTFLATFNVLYRRSVLEAVGGFDERLQKGQDGELSWRVLEAGSELAFEVRSRVRHFHPTSWPGYLATQARQGFWRVWMYAAFPRKAAGDSYSGLLDHVQPVLALAVVGSLPMAAVTGGLWIPGSSLVALALTQIPMTWRLIRRTGRTAYAAFPLLGVTRSFLRAFGALGGLASVLRGRLIGSGLGLRVTGR